MERAKWSPHTLPRPRQVSSLSFSDVDASPFAGAFVCFSSSSCADSSLGMRRSSEIAIPSSTLRNESNDTCFHRYFSRKLSITPADIRVLVADNNPAHATLIVQCLLRAGYPVSWALSTEQAFELLKDPSKSVASELSLADSPESETIDMPSDTEYSLLITDISSVNGIDLLKRIRLDQDLRHLPVIVMAVPDEMDLAYTCLRAGADDYLVKPVKTEAVRGVWRSVWRKRKEKKVLELLDEERAQRITLESKVKKLQDQVSAAVETPLNLITRAVSSLLTNEDSRMSEEARDTLRAILEGLKSSNLYRPAFEKMINNADLDIDTKSWLSSEVLRENVDIISQDRYSRIGQSSHSVGRNSLTSAPRELIITNNTPNDNNTLSEGSQVNFKSLPLITSLRSKSTTTSFMDELNARKTRNINETRSNRQKSVQRPPVQSTTATTTSGSSQSLLIPTTITQEVLPSSPAIYSLSPVFNASPFTFPDVEPYSLTSIELPTTLPNPMHVPLLKTWSFDVWSYTHGELIAFLMDLFADMGILTAFNIKPENLLAFISDVERGYSMHDNLYHNFRHAFDVTQAGYLFLKTCNGEADQAVRPYTVSSDTSDGDSRSTTSDNNEDQSKNTALSVEFDVKERLGFLIACLCHDLCHDDLAKHVEVLTRFNEIVPSFAPTDKEHRLRTLEMLMKCADVSNVIRPLHLAKGWADNIQEEMFEQGDIEQNLGLSVSGFGDRHHPQSARLGITFSDYMCAPLFRTIGKGLKGMEEFIRCVAVTSNYWNGMLNESSSPETSPSGCDESSTMSSALTKEEDDDAIASP